MSESLEDRVRRLEERLARMEERFGVIEADRHPAGYRPATPFIPNPPAYPYAPFQIWSTNAGD